MNYRVVCICAVVGLAMAMASAQTKVTLSGTCSKPDVEHSVPVPDQAGHVFMVAQGKCTASGEVNGAMGKDGVFAEHGEATATHLKNSGIFAETFDSGDKVFYSYQTTGTMKDGAFQGGTNKWQMTRGTGKMKGIKGSGTCKLTATADGGLDYECSGEYTLAAAAATKQ